MNKSVANADGRVSVEEALKESEKNKVLVLGIMPQSGEEVNLLVRLRDEGWHLVLFQKGNEARLKKLLKDNCLQDFFDDAHSCHFFMGGEYFKKYRSAKEKAFIGDCDCGGLGPAKDSNFSTVEVYAGCHDPLGKVVVRCLGEALERVLKTVSVDGMFAKPWEVHLDQQVPKPK